MNRQEIIEKLKGYRANGKEIGDLRRSTAELQSELEALEQSTRATKNTRGKRTCEKHNRALKSNNSLLLKVPTEALKGLFPDWEKLTDPKRETIISESFYTTELLGDILCKRDTDTESGDTLADKLRTYAVTWFEGNHNIELDANWVEVTLLPHVSLLAKANPQDDGTTVVEFECFIDGKDAATSLTPVTPTFDPNEGEKGYDLESIAIEAYLEWMGEVSSDPSDENIMFWANVLLDYYYRLGMVNEGVVEDIRQGYWGYYPSPASTQTPVASTNESITLDNSDRSVALINDALKEDGSLLCCLPKEVFTQLFCFLAQDLKNPQYEEACQDSTVYYKTKILGDLICERDVTFPSAGGQSVVIPGDTLEDKLRAYVVLWFEGNHNEVSDKSVKVSLIPGLALNVTVEHKQDLGVDVGNIKTSIDGQIAESCPDIVTLVPGSYRLELVATNLYLDWMEKLSNDPSADREHRLWATAMLDHYSRGSLADQDIVEAIQDGQWEKFLRQSPAKQTGVIANKSYKHSGS